MIQKKYLTTGIILFTIIMSAYAFNFFDKEVHTLPYYETKIDMLFKEEKWEEGKKLLDESMEYYSNTSGINELAGRYYYQYLHDYDTGRFYLVRAVRDNPENVVAKQMLINLEDESGNYSSAICYVNELLEINPYWKGLWRKKIGLYRKQGNDVEADRLLKRLHQIYPNDTTVTKDYAGSLEEKLLKHREKGEQEKAIESLYSLIEVTPDNEEYYLMLTNQLLQQGNTEEALLVTGKGVSNLPGSTLLILKRASILAEEGRYQEALTFVHSRRKYNKSPQLARFEQNLLGEAAHAAQMNDPYVLYGRMYENSKSDEALDYLISNSILKGYNDEALYYLAEAKRQRGEQTSLLYKEYTVYKRMGNISKAYSLLSTLAEMNPNDTGLMDELANIRLQLANNLIHDELYAEALPYLKAAARDGYDPELKAAAISKAYACHYELKEYDTAQLMLDSLHRIYPDDDTYSVKKADILNRQERTQEALAILDTALSDTTLFDMRPMYANAYEEIAVPYIKQLIEKGASSKAYEESTRLLRFNPSSIEGLQYAIGMSDKLERYDDYDRHVLTARSIYPEETAYVVKQAASYTRKGDYQGAVDMIRPWLDAYPDNQGLTGAFSENSEKFAYQLINAHRPDSALAVTDTALLFDARNQSLLLAKGTVYEAMKQYDSAYYYQSRYIPGITEVAEFKRHLNGLQSRALHNEVTAEYLQGRFGEDNVITSVATISYSRHNEKNTYTGRLNYAGRDGSDTGSDPEAQTPGGQGIQLQGEWSHQFSPRWSGTAMLAGANKYFPKITADLKLSRAFKNDVTLDFHANYRRIETYTKAYRWSTDEPEGWVFNGWDEHQENLFSAGAGVTKAWDKILLSGKADGFLLSSNIYFNASAQLKYFPLEDGRTNFTLTGGVGTAPEGNMIDYAMPGSFDKLNTTVGLGGTYMLNKHTAIGVMGTWHTFYNQTNQRKGTLNNYYETIETKYKNLFNVHLQLHIYF